MNRLLSILLVSCFVFPAAGAKPIEVLVYSATAWYRHPEIPRINGYLARLGTKHDINISVTENAKDLKTASLKQYDLVLFNNATNLGESVPEDIQKDDPPPGGPRSQGGKPETQEETMTSPVMLSSNRTGNARAGARTQETRGTQRKSSESSLHT